MNRNKLNILILFILFATSCKVLPTKSYLAKQAKIEFTPDSKLTKEEKKALRSRLYIQQDDSVKVTIKTSLFFIKTLVKPIVYDSLYAKISSKNMEASMHHIGYYKAKVTDTAYYFKRKKFGIFKLKDSVQEVGLKYIVNTGLLTRIDTFYYRLKNTDLQKIALSSIDKSFIKKNDPITKVAVLSEITRLVDSFRNNGYYKFTASELRMRGDSSIAALTNISDDPFEQLEALIDAQKKRDSPTIKLALVLIKPEDTTKLNKYTINKIYILSDFRAGDNVSDLSKFSYLKTKNFIHLYHQNIFKTALLERNFTLHSGDIYRQEDYYTAINNLSKLAVWQNVNIRLIENFDEPNKLDIVVELTPAKRLTPAFDINLNYSAAGANNNVIAGNLFGTSLNFSVENKNFAREAIKMSHNFRFGIEFRGRNTVNTNNLIQSNEVSYSNDIKIPRLLIPSINTLKIDPRFWFYKLLTPKTAAQLYAKDKTETFINTTLSYSNRIGLFNLQNIGLSYGYRSKNEKNNIFTFKYLTVEYSKLFNESPYFESLLNANPFLRYSYNTSFVMGMGSSYSSNHALKQRNNRLRDEAFKISGEAPSIWGLIPLLEKNEVRKRFVKFDVEYKYNVNYNKKTSANIRGYIGVGIPLRNDEALPFFKQFAGGGSSSMRGWPIRGIGRGGQPLQPLSASNAPNLFNDRTGDIQLEFNAEYRHPIVKIYTDLITLKGAFFVDAGNIWNVLDNVTDEKAVFTGLESLKDTAIGSGLGLRYDFNFFVVRIDFGFKTYVPANETGKKWFRDYNFNKSVLNIGINYPF